MRHDEDKFPQTEKEQAILLVLGLLVALGLLSGLVQGIGS